MSRKAKSAISIPKGVDVKIEKELVTVKGPKGTLMQKYTPGIEIVSRDGEVTVAPTKGREKELSAFQGLYWSLLANMVKGVSEGFEKKLEMIGVGYRAAVQGKLLDVQIGLSHPTKVEIPEGIAVSVEKNTVILIKGIDKQKVGQFAADVRALRPPEPYKGKGIRYSDEYVRRKAGKAGKKAGAAGGAAK